jgi:hypothetical protein
LRCSCFLPPSREAARANGEAAEAARAAEADASEQFEETKKKSEKLLGKRLMLMQKREVRRVDVDRGASLFRVFSAYFRCQRIFFCFSSSFLV